MKFLAISLLLPVLVVATTSSSATTEDWSKEDSFTLNSEAAPTTNVKPTDTPVVKVSGAEQSTAPSQPKEPVSTEDPILPLILKKLIEDKLNNIDSDTTQPPSSNPTSKRALVHVPLVYMTPPAPLLPKDYKNEAGESTTISFDDGESSEELTSTTPDPDSDIPTITADSSEDDVDSTEVTTIKNSKDTPQYLQYDQYASKFQNYFPEVDSEKPKDKRRNEAQMQQMNEQSDEVITTPIDEIPHSHIPEVGNHMDRVIFNKPEPEQDQNENDSKESTEAPQTEDSQEVTPEPDTPPTMTPMTPQQRPVYYFFVRPSPYRRQNFFNQPMSYYDNGYGMMPPKSYSPSEDSWQLYPPKQMYSRNIVPVQGQGYDFPITAQTYNMPYSLPTNQYQYQPMRNMAYQIPTQQQLQNYYDYRNPSFNQMYTASSMSSGLGFNGDYFRGGQFWTRPYYRNPYYSNPSYPYNGYNYNYPSTGYSGLGMGNTEMAPRFSFF